MEEVSQLQDGDASGEKEETVRKTNNKERKSDLWHLPTTYAIWNEQAQIKQAQKPNPWTALQLLLKEIILSQRLYFYTLSLVIELA